MKAFGIVAALIFVASISAGCHTGVTESDAAQVRAEFSQDKYEAAMKAAGKGAELEAEKKAAAERGE